MLEEKTLRQTDATHVPSGLRVRGYEIHHGQTGANGTVAVTMESDAGTALGYASRDGLIWGTYLHGVFESDDFRRWFLDDLRSRCQLAPIERSTQSYGLEPALDQLAVAVREHVDMEQIYRVMGL